MSQLFFGTAEHHYQSHKGNRLTLFHNVFFFPMYIGRMPVPMILLIGLHSAVGSAAKL